jgi:hypothetical protein
MFSCFFYPKKLTLRHCKSVPPSLYQCGSSGELGSEFVRHPDHGFSLILLPVSSSSRATQITICINTISFRIGCDTKQADFSSRICQEREPWIHFMSILEFGKHPRTCEANVLSCNQNPSFEIQNAERTLRVIPRVLD